MRYVSAGLMGLGGILIAFGAVVFVLEFFASRADSGHGLREMTALATGALVVGGMLLGLGFLLSRIGRKSNHPAPSRRGTA